MIHCISLGLSLNLSILLSDRKNKHEILSTGEGTGLQSFKLLVVIECRRSMIADRRWEVSYNERNPH